MIATADGFHRLDVTHEEFVAVLPQEWGGQQRFVAWRPEQRKGKWTKVPVNPHTGKPASSTDPSTWGTLLEALAFHNAHEESRGVGIVFSDGAGEVGIDLDNCIDEDGRIEAWAQDILKEFPTYAEVSPSGRGVKLWAKGPALDHGTRRADFPVEGSAVEMYSSGRYFTLTGNRLEEAPREVKDCSAAVKALFKRLIPEAENKVKAVPMSSPPQSKSTAVSLSDDAIIDMAMRAKNGSNFRALWEGRYNGTSQSEADLALCGSLAFYTGRDADRIDRLFRRSGLMREKWERPDYRNRTISKALEGRSEFWNGGRMTGTPATTPKSCAPYVSFPVEALPPATATFVRTVARSLECDEALAALPVLGVCAGAVSNARQVEVKPGWTEPAILWCAVIAQSGAGKSPVLRYALEPLHLDEAKYMLLYREKLVEYEREKLVHEKAVADWKRHGGTMPDKPVEPVALRRVIEDTTVEAVARVLEANPRGLTVGRDELGAWLGSFDRYNATGGADLPLWLQLHNGASLRVDRAGKPPRFVARASLSIVGGIQPGAFESAFDAASFDAGLAARLILAMPPARLQRWTDEGVDDAARLGYRKIIDRLLSLRPLAEDVNCYTPVTLTLTAGAKALLKDFINGQADAGEDLNDNEAAAWSKLRGGAARLALIVHLLRWAESDRQDSETGPVDESSMRAGIQIATWAWSETRRIYAVLAEGAINRDRRKLVEALRRIGRPVTANDLQRLYKPVKGDGAAAEAALDDLRSAGLGEWRESSPGTPGPHTRYFHLADTSVSESPSLPIPPDSPTAPASFGDSEIGRQESARIGVEPPNHDNDTEDHSRNTK